MFGDLVAKLRDLKALVGPAYYADLQAVAMHLITGDYRAAHDGVWTLGKRVSGNHFFPDAPVVAMAVPEEALDSALADLENGTVLAMAAGPDAVGITPGEIIAIATLIMELLKMWKDRKKQ